MEDTVCRTCLSSSDLKPIFKNSEDHDSYSTAIFGATGVYIVPNDGLPQSMCLNCKNFLNDSLKFRQKCRDTEEYLLKIKNESESTTLDTICEMKNDDFEAKEDKDNVNFKIEKCEYFNVPLDDNDDDVDDDKPIKDWLDETIDTSKTQDVVVVKEESIKIEETKIIIPTVRQRTSCQYCSKKISIRCLTRHIAEKHHDAVDKSTIGDKIVAKEKVACHRKTKQSDGKIFKCWYCRKHYSEELLTEHVPNCTKRKKPMKQPKKQRPNGSDHGAADPDLETGKTQRTIVEQVKEFAQCDLCQKTMLKSSIRMHIAIKHEGKGPVCEDHGAADPDLETGKTQRTIVEQVKEFAQCDLCQKTMLKSSIRMHIAIKHEGKGPVCEHCGRRFANNRRLSEHRRARHGHAKFKCGQCDYQSARKDTLQNHERLHRGERPFVCEACGQGFHSLHLLYQHRQSHRTERAIKCDKCPAVFKANNSLHVHKMTCHSATAFRCALCGRTFRCRTYAVRHVKHVHSSAEPASVVERLE